MNTEADFRRQIRLQQEEIEALVVSNNVHQITNRLLNEDIDKLKKDVEYYSDSRNH
jgi:hypothetical protein